MRQQTMSAFRVAPVEIDGIREGLKRVERKAERKNPIPSRAKQQGHVAGTDQQSKVERDAGANQGPAKGWQAETHQSQANRIIHKRTYRQKQSVEDAELRTEDVIGQQNHAQASAAGASGNPIEEEDGGHEKVVCAATNLHLDIVARQSRDREGATAEAA